ncbi:MAG: DNA-protecting protein DprA [Saprospiraceae bacterium]|nr:DNA-protecting protein DprA [Saprospiraceae bacterium]
MTEQDDLLYKIALTHLPKVGAVLARNLVSFAGGVEAVFSQKKSQLLKIPGIGTTTANDIVNHRSLKKAESELAFITKHSIKPLFYLDQEYPIRLKRIKDAPTLLYYRGNADMNAERVLAVVGTRKPTSYGINQCEKLVDYLRNKKVLVVSGLAYGIDIVSHRKALEVGLPTIGVMGSGLDRIYPAVHRKTAREMIDHGGLLTEFGSGTKPDRENFPMRNRIIAGMCDALIVIESDIKGGSMITAELANTYHKDVFAIPGKIGDQYSRGCNHLIKTNRACLIDGGEDLAEIMQWKELRPIDQVQTKLFVDLSDEEHKVLGIMQQNCPVSIDKMLKESSYTSSELASILLNLEFQGIIKALPGKLYLRI